MAFQRVSPLSDDCYWIKGEGECAGCQECRLYAACWCWWWWQVRRWGGGSRWVHVEVRVSSLSLNGKLKFAFGDWTNLSRTPFTFYITQSFWREMHFCETLKASDTLLRVWALSVCDMHYYISVRITKTVTVSYTSYLIS